jgi:hypothetical protein
MQPPAAAVESDENQDGVAGQKRPKNRPKETYKQAQRRARASRAVSVA